jgi:hypothetical protein
MEVPYRQNLTVYELLTNTLNRIGESRFFLYDGLNNNCQIFIKDILESNNMYSPKINEFLFQDLTELKQQLPSYVGKTMNMATDLGAIASQLMGAGLTLHSIKINKTVPLDKQLEHVKNISKSNKKRMAKEMTHVIAYRITPKTKFEKDSFRTKKVNENISIVFGKLKE